MSVLYKVMKENNVHEGCIEQIERLFKEKRLLADTITDEHGWVRMDDLELRDDIQDEVKKRWEEINTDNVIGKIFTVCLDLKRKESTTKQKQILL